VKLTITVFEFWSKDKTGFCDLSLLEHFSWKILAF